MTGLTGTPPYSFLWSTLETGQQITGLTEGTYSVTVTDSLGCKTQKSAVIGKAQPLGLGLLTAVNPSCFGSDGSLTFTLTGGTAPFYYSAVTNEVGYTLSDTFTISNLAGGAYQVSVRDANFCEVILNGTLNSLNGFNVVDVKVEQSSCSSSNGTISVNIQGANNFYTYAISGLTTNNTDGITTQSQTHTFRNLESDTYLLVISGTGTNCSYSQTIPVLSTNKFNVSLTATTTSCGNNNGSLYFEVGTGYSAPLDFVLSDGQSLIDVNLSAYTFDNLPAGNYTLSVTDNANCTVSNSVQINQTSDVAAMVITQNCTGTNDGEATVIINQGEPTFSYQWSSNIPGNPTGSTVTNLSGGNYTVLVTDSTGCNKKFDFQILCGSKNISQYQIVPVSENKFFSNSLSTTPGQKRDFYKMLNEGYVDLTSGYTNCLMTGATFTCEINIAGTAYTQTFYTSTGLNDVPQDSVWQSTIENILSSIPQVTGYSVNLLTNELQINTDGNLNPSSGETFTLILTIDYDINCESSANTMCFNFSSSTTGYTYTSTPQGINNNRPYYEVKQGTFTGYVYWDNVYNVWVFSNTLGGDIDDAFSKLDNFYSPNPTSDITYLWGDGPMSNTYKMNSSTNGSCP